MRKTIEKITNKKYVIILSVTIVAIILTIFIGVNIYYSSKVKQADESMNQKDYGNAVTLYSQALNIFNKSDIQSKLSKAKELQKSKVSYNLGIDNLQNKEYYLAYIDFKDVIEDDIDNYDDSIKKQEESKNLYIADKITEAKKNALDNKYDIAIICLNSALNLDSQNSDVLNLRSQYDSLKKEADAKASADEKAKAEEIKQADIEKKKNEGVRIGMTKDEVLGSSWGKPKSINKTTTQGGIHEQWVYGGNNYLYFDNGILTSIQN